MSGPEILGIVAGVLQIADLGGKVSVKLFTFSKKVRDADKSIDIISKDIASTGAVLQQLGCELAKDKSGQASLCSQNLVQSAQDLIQECKKIFANIDQAIDGNSGNKIILGFKQKLKYTYFEPQIELLRTNLERLKSSLAVLLNVLIYAEQIKTRQTSVVLRQQEELIQILGRETAKNESRLTRLLKTLNLEQDEDSDDYSATRMETISTQTTLINAQLGEPAKAIELCLSANTPESSRSTPSYAPAPHSAPAVGVGTSNGALGTNSVIAPRIIAPDLMVIEHYILLVLDLVTAIHAKRYGLKPDMQERLQMGIFEVHWQEWYPLRRIYGMESLWRRVVILPELALFWANKHEKEHQSVAVQEGSIAPYRKRMGAARKKRKVVDEVTPTIPSSSLRSPSTQIARRLVEERCVRRSSQGSRNTADNDGVDSGHSDESFLASLTQALIDEQSMRAGINNSSGSHDPRISSGLEGGFGGRGGYNASPGEGSEILRREDHPAEGEGAGGYGGRGGYNTGRGGYNVPPDEVKAERPVTHTRGLLDHGGSSRPHTSAGNKPFPSSATPRLQVNGADARSPVTDSDESEDSSWDTELDDFDDEEDDAGDRSVFPRRTISLSGERGQHQQQFMGRRSTVHYASSGMQNDENMKSLEKKQRHSRSAPSTMMSARSTFDSTTNPVHMRPTYRRHGRTPPYHMSMSQYRRLGASPSEARSTTPPTPPVDSSVRDGYPPQQIDELCVESGVLSAEGPGRGKGASASAPPDDASIPALAESVITDIVQKRLGADLDLAALDVSALVLRWTTLSEKDLGEDEAVV